MKANVAWSWGIIPADFVKVTGMPNTWKVNNLLSWKHWSVSPTLLEINEGYVYGNMLPQILLIGISKKT